MDLIERLRRERAALIHKAKQARKEARTLARHIKTIVSVEKSLGRGGVIAHHQKHNAVAKRKISAAQKARWAKIRAEKKG